MVNGEDVEDIEKFSCLRATVDEEGGSYKALTNWLPKARSVL